MSRSGLIVAVDVGVAVLLAALVLIVSPGIAVTGMIALFVVFVCVVSLAVERWGRRSGRRRRYRSS